MIRWSSAMAKAGSAERTKRDSLIDLDDPAEWDLPEPQPDTKRPSFAPDQFAQLVESAEARATTPPAPTYEMLRDSCRRELVAEPFQDEFQLDEFPPPMESAAVRVAARVTAPPTRAAVPPPPKLTAPPGRR
jgi:hypothetical protein